MKLLVALVAASLASAGVRADENLAKQLANPVAALISVPFQLNYDQDIGPAREGVRYWAGSPDSGPDSWGVRLIATLLK